MQHAQIEALLGREMPHTGHKCPPQRVMHAPIYEPATLHGVGLRVEEPGVGLIPPLFFTAPYEDMRLKKP